MIIKCPECGHDVSDKAGCCPKCGCPIADEKGKSRVSIIAFKLILILIIVAASAAFIVYYVSLNKGDQPLPKSADLETGNDDLNSEAVDATDGVKETQEYIQDSEDLGETLESEESSKPSENEEIVEEPISMHFYETIYSDEIHVLDYTLKFDHDSKGRISKVTNYDSNGSFIDALWQEYDDDGNCIIKYTYGTTIDEFILESEIQYWENGNLVKTRSTGGYYESQYKNDADGKPLVCYHYDDDETCYMEDDYTYDSQGRVSSIYRENYGNWSFVIDYHYHGTDEKPYYVQWGDDDYYMYEYTYDDKGRLIEEKQKYYSDGELYSDQIKTYKY